MSESWTPVKGWPHYWVSSSGRILRATDRFGKWVGRELMGFYTPGGYRRVRLHNGKGGHRDIFVHHIVLENFIGPMPNIPCYEAMHVDGDPRNNRDRNLRWGSCAENYQDQREHGTAAIGERNGASKLTDRQRREIARSKLHRSELARQYGVSESTIRRVRHGPCPSTAAIDAWPKKTEKSCSEVDKNTPDIRITC